MATYAAIFESTAAFIPASLAFLKKRYWAWARQRLLFIVSVSLLKSVVRLSGGN